MKKLDFLLALQENLSWLPPDDLEERLGFYSEMIDDRMDEGLPEEEAVAQIGDVGQIASQVINETPLTHLVRNKLKTDRHFAPWEILLLVLGFPLWFPLLIAAFAVVVSLYAVLWSGVAGLWSVFVSVFLCAPASGLAGAVLALNGHTASGIFMIGGGILCAGLAIFLFFGCKSVSKGALWLTKKAMRGIKRCFIKKEAA